jgi:formylmethanofuran dehydrogenase subunit B
MGRAWIGGKPAALERALAEAAGLLAASRCPLIAGLGTDVAGARAAIGLAERTGGVIDHMNSDALLRDLAVLREAGMMVITPNEARLRADTLLLVGPSLEKEAPDLSRWLGLGSSGKGAAAANRSVVRLCPGGGAAIPGERIVACDRNHLPVVLAAMRARRAGRPVGKTAIRAKTIEQIATLLKAARFGVAVWSAVDLDALAIEMLCGIVADLNVATRFSGFAIPPGDNATGVLQACGWMTGFPMRTGFGRGHPEHDPWRHDGARMVAAGEADCVVWISAYRAAAPRWPDGAPVIALATGEATRGRAPAVQIEVGQPGVDHDGVEQCPMLGTLVAVAATRRSETISVADAIAAIMAAMPGTQVAA